MATSTSQNMARAYTREFDNATVTYGNDPIVSKTELGGSPAHQLQMSSISCTWSKPSRDASLHYYSSWKVAAARSHLEDSMILGQKSECTYPVPPPARRNFQSPRPTWSFKGNNLDVLTKEEHFREVLPESLWPDRLVIGPASYSRSDAEVAEMIKSMLEPLGLKSFEPSPSLPGNKLKAVATFPDISIAKAAVNLLHTIKLHELNNMTVLAANIISVNYNILTPIYRVIKLDLDRLSREVCANGQIHIKITPPKNRHERFIRLQISGDEVRPMAVVKASLEDLLRGEIITVGGTVLWNERILTPGFMAFIKEIAIDHGMYIHRDVRTSRLIMYGGTETSRKAVCEGLTIRARPTPQEVCTIIPDSSLMTEAMRAGWSRIHARFGNAAKIDVIPNGIYISGSKYDLTQARRLLFDVDDSVPLPANELCSICLSEPIDPLTTPCDHTYCKECFINQCSSVSHEGLPIECFGAGGTCRTSFTMEPLKSMLSVPAFEKLLQDYYESHIRLHPEVYRYCPTPDCSHVYRRSSDGTKFLCSSCLTLVCTTCDAIDHDSMTCQVYQDLISEAARALNDWKEEHDVRDCPCCKAPIEKTAGCNHIECSNCRKHICWFCMKHFNSGEGCYGHMREVHGSFYDNGEGEVLQDYVEDEGGVLQHDAEDEGLQQNAVDDDPFGDDLILFDDEG